MRRLHAVLCAVLLACALALSACNHQSTSGAGEPRNATPSTPGEPSTKKAKKAAARKTGGPAPSSAGPQRRQPQPSPTLSVPDLDLPARRIPGGDVSWPQCPRGMGIPEKKGLGLPMPLPDAEFVIMGLTNGPAFTPNPCLQSQVAWVRERGLWAGAYSVSSYPDDQTLRRYGSRGPYDGSTRLGALRNVGYQQARYNLRTMRRAGLFAPAVWIDVEPVPVFEWSVDKRANAAVVEGVARGYLDAGFRIGAYSTPALWDAVVGGLRLGIPEWRAAGQTSRAEALSRCARAWSFQGGEAVLAQWVEKSRDRNITCGKRTDMFRWFHHY